MLVRGHRDGQIVHITEVERGLACNCVCPNPSCRGRLVAHIKGDGKAKHFKHWNGIECEYGAETSLHYLAKDLLNEALELFVPPFPNPENRKLPPLLKGGTYKFAHARSEVRVDAIIPDTVVTLVDERGVEHMLLVEFTVTHKCGPEKLARVATAGLPMIEIDLSKVDREASREEIRDLVVVSAPRKWLNCPKGNARFAEIVAERERLAKSERDKKLKRFHSARVKKAAAVSPKPELELKRYGLDKYAGIPLPGDYVFEVSNLVWQTEILQRFVLEEKRSHPDIAAVFMTKDALTLVKHHTTPAFRGFLTEREVEALLDVDPSFKTPYEVVKAYLEWLSAQKVVHELRRMRWQVQSSVADPIARSKRDVIRIPEETEALKKKVTKLLADLPPSEIEGFSFESWFEKPMPEGGDTPKAFVVADQLEGLLFDLENAGSDAHFGRTEEYFFGLPLEAEARRRHRFIVEECERRAAERQADEALAQRQRIQQLEEYARALGIDYLNHLAEPSAPGTGTNLMALASQSGYGLGEAKSYLSRLHEEACWRQEQETKAANARQIARSRAQEAASKSENPEAASRYLLTVDPLYASPPIDACVDEPSLQAVLVRMTRYVQGYKYSRRRRGSYARR